METIFELVKWLIILEAHIGLFTVAISLVIIGLECLADLIGDKMSKKH